MAVSSAYLRNMVVVEELVRSFLYNVYKNGLRTQPSCGAPVLLVVQVWLLCLPR